MIIKKFEEQVERFYEKPALKKAERELTYGQLNAYADKIGRAVTAETTGKAGEDQSRQVALFFEHGIDMVVGALGVLKADCAYVPLDISYPGKRLLYLLEDSGSRLILTNHRNFPLAQQLAGQTGGKCSVLNIEAIGGDIPETPVQRRVSGERTAYILYTSGSTGKPKGVYQTLRNMWYYTRNWIERFSITDADRMSLFTSFTHDGAVQDIFSALLSGACLYPYSMKEDASIEELYLLLVQERITLWHSVPSLYRFFANALTEKDQFYDIRWVLLGGEPLREHDLQLLQIHFPKAPLANVYGQTESSVGSICTVSRENTFDDISLGEPLDETELLLVGEDGDMVETMGVGEIVVACDYLAPGYWRDKENSGRVFTHDEELGRLYWTGDLGRLTAEGFIKMMGRKDFQVKVRGFRVETGEIETVLLQHPAVKETVIIAKPDDNGDNFLCAYIVTGETIAPDALRKYLSAELPDYMAPRYFIFLEKMPVNPTGKIDRQQLPEPEEAAASESIYVPPTNEIEKKVVEIWQEVLGVPQVGINDNFIELGGHSLLVITIISKIHQLFNVELQLRDVFEYPTVKELSQLIAASEESVFSAVEPTPEKAYYAVTSDQKRLFVLSRFEGINTTYNLIGTFQLEGELDRQRFERAFQKLAQRYDVLRTSFKMAGGELVQVIHEKIDLQMPYRDAREKTGRPLDQRRIKTFVDDFIRPYDLSKAPLFRIALVKLSGNNHLFLMDIHHIISDGVSQNILIIDFSRLYAGEELPALKLRYRDYAEWENRLFHSGKLQEQEEYWLQRFKGEIPVLNLPTNYPRPAVQSFEGDVVEFSLGAEISRQLYRLVRETGATLYIVLLAMYNVLLYKYTGQEDLIVGTIITGRNHADLEQMVGFFAKTLALRNYPAGHKTFEGFLTEVKETTLQAFQNQMYPFERLVGKLNLRKDQSRNPLFDAAFIVQNINADTSADTDRETDSEPVLSPGGGLKVTPLGHGGDRTSMFDLLLEIVERDNQVRGSFQFCSKLFKLEAIELMKDRFLILIENILNNVGTEISDLEYAVPVEKEMRKVQTVEFDF